MTPHHHLIQLTASGVLGATTAAQFGDGALIAAGAAATATLVAVLRAGIKAMIRDEIRSVKEQLHPNGGDNIRDQVDSIVEHLGIKQTSN